MSARTSVVTVTLNAAVDKTYLVPTLPLGRVTRVPEMVAYPGGKGVNVARVLKQLGVDVVAAGFVAGHNGAFIRTELTKQGIAHDFVDLPGESRLCLNILHDGGTSTELLEPGPTVTEADLEALERKLAALAADAAIVAFSGSAPSGAPADVYARLIAVARAAGALAFLDTSGALLVEGLRAKPDFVKPNQDEIAALQRRPAATDGDLAALVRELVAGGIGCAAITLGADGSLVGADGAVYRVRVPALPVVSAVGCGDAFVAGFAAATLRGEPIEARLRLAAAAACANALHREAGRVDAAELERLLPRIDVAPW